MADDKKTEQGDVDEPEAGGAEAAAAEGAGAAEDVVGAAEQPSEGQQEREQAIADEPVAESEQRIAEATAPAEAPADADATAPTAAGATAPTAAGADAPAAAGAPTAAGAAAEEVDETPRVKPEIPGADLEVDIVREGEDTFGDRPRYSEDEPEDEAGGEFDADDLTQPIADASIDLAAAARYRATGKRKSAIARVALRPGTGEYVVNGRSLEQHFPRPALQRTIRQPLETVGYESRIDVVATMHGGGVSAQAGALRHGISRALIEAAPSLRAELKRRGFLTRDPRVKERKKAGFKKARKRPQFSKR
jgi:small subunit ribosomal protein S9